MDFSTPRMLRLKKLLLLQQQLGVILMTAENADEFDNAAYYYEKATDRILATLENLPESEDYHGTPDGSPKEYPALLDVVLRVGVTTAAAKRLAAEDPWGMWEEDRHGCASYRDLCEEWGNDEA